MASLLEIKKRIGGIQNTRKITRAMQLVASSKMQYFQKRATSMSGFIHGLIDLLESNLQSEGHSLYTKNIESNKILFVLYTSDKGLCGALNTKLLNTFSDSPEWKNTPEEDRLLITIGRKSNEFAQRQNIPIYKHLSGFSEKLETLEALDLIDEILQIWKSDKVKQVFFIHPHFINSFTYYPIQKQFLPLNQEMIDSQKIKEEDAEDNAESAPISNREEEIIFEPSAEHLTERLHQMIVQSLFTQAFLELKAAEYSSRMLAMKNATDSADNIIDDLTLIYNKARQQAITQEIAELVGATAAVSN